MLETRFCRRRQATRRSSSCLGRSTCCGVPRQRRRRLSCRKQSGPGHGVPPEQAVDVMAAPGARRPGWCAAPELHAVGTRSSGGHPSRPGALGQTPVGVEVERKRLRARRRRCRCPWRRLRSQKQCRPAGRDGQGEEGLGHLFSLAQWIASPTGDNLQFSRRVFLHQQFFWRGGATRRTRGRHRRRQVPVRLGTAVMVALHWLRAGGSTFLLRGHPASLRHSDHSCKACLEAAKAASRLDPAGCGLRDFLKTPSSRV